MYTFFMDVQSKTLKTLLNVSARDPRAFLFNVG
jgi:hypothetical protein